MQVGGCSTTATPRTLFCTRCAVEMEASTLPPTYPGIYGQRDRESSSNDFGADDRTELDI